MEKTMAVAQITSMNQAIVDNQVPDTFCPMIKDVCNTKCINFQPARLVVIETDNHNIDPIMCKYFKLEIKMLSKKLEEATVIK